ncbi:MAG: helix-turn-helix domain-containing protein, partial [Sphingomonadales bacterium]
VLDPFESPWRPVGPKEKTKTPSPPPPAEAPNLPHARVPIDLKETLKELEKSFVEEALEVNKFHQKKAARHLGLSYDQLRHAMKKHGLL